MRGRPKRCPGGGFEKGGQVRAAFLCVTSMLFGTWRPRSLLWRQNNQPCKAKRCIVRSLRTRGVLAAVRRIGHIRLRSRTCSRPWYRLWFWFRAHWLSSDGSTKVVSEVWPGHSIHCVQSPLLQVVRLRVSRVGSLRAVQGNPPRRLLCRSLARLVRDGALTIKKRRSGRVTTTFRFLCSTRWGGGGVRLKG